MNKLQAIWYILTTRTYVVITGQRIVGAAPSDGVMHNYQAMLDVISNKKASE